VTDEATPAPENTNEATDATTEATPDAMSDHEVHEVHESHEDAEVLSSGKEPSRWRRPALIAAGIGVVGLLLGAAGGYAAGENTGSDGDSGSSSTASGKLALPSTLSGGFKRDTSVDKQIADAVTSAQTTLGVGTDMALYAQGQTQVLVEATRLPGQAVLNAGMTYTKVGKAVCSSSTSSSGSEAICVRSDDDLTVKVTATDQKTAAKYVEEVYTAVA
jgi:hypothetical protein